MSEVAENIVIRERFDVDNDMKAEWCLSKIRKIKAQAEKEIEELNRQMEFYKKEIEAIQSKEKEDIDFFTGLLLDYYKIRKEEGFTKSTKTQTVYKLPTGKLVMKKREPKFDPKGEDFMKWLKDNNMKEFIEVKETPKWGDFKKTLPKDKDGNIKLLETDEGIGIVTADGEIVPGVTVTYQDDDFYVEG